MAFYKDYAYAITGNTVAFRKGQETAAASLPPNQGVKLLFHPLPGKIAIAAVAYDLKHQSRLLVTHTDPQGTPDEEFNLIAVKIELFAPNTPVAVRTWTTRSEWSRTDGVGFDYLVGGSAAETGGWECHLTNVGTVSAEVHFSVGYIFSTKPLLAGRLPFVLLDQTYQVILDVLTPTAEIVGDHVEVRFDEELKRFFGGIQPTALASTSYPLPFGLEGTGRLASLALEACSGHQLLDAMHRQYQSVDATLRKELALVQSQVQLAQAITANIAKNDAWRQDWEHKVAPQFVVIHATVTFTNIHLDREVDLLVGHIDVDIADIENAVVHLYMAFDSMFQQCHALVLTPATLTGGLAELGMGLGFIPQLNALADSVLSPRIESASALLGRYLGEALGRLCAPNPVFMQATADDSAWHVQYTALPLEASDGNVLVGGGGHIVGGGGGQVKATLTSAGGAGGNMVASGGSEGSGITFSLGVLPPESEFMVGSPAALARLDKIETLVVVMMENRSFDHMLGYLHQSRGPAYEGVKGGESNHVTSRNQPVKLRRARDVVPPPVTQIKLGPEHGFAHVPYQIADGAMSGFAQDYENSYPGNAEMVMTYYTGEELKTYDQIAGSFAVCDHWFAAHPGPTWPNRWTTMSGTTPDLENPPNSDPRLGFLPQFTIFDLLNLHQIGWRVFESDLALIRTYNSFRLDSTHVTPRRNRRDPTQDFAAVAARGELPPVVFVEPNFSDLPPLASADDDLVPVDVRRGQNFVSEVYKTLMTSPQRKGMLLLITYDEHGGFFDHVPPPGTKSGPPEFYDAVNHVGTIPLINPKGAPFLGVRVPTMVVSPWVSAGSVCKQQFDHTSIIKTILLLHRAKLQTEQFTIFGPRVNQAAHLGMALNLDTPRTEWPTLPHMARGANERVNPGLRIRQGVTLGDIHESLRHAFLPRA